MSGFIGIFLIVGILALLGTATLVVITLKYYWGERGTPPLGREQRRKSRADELRLRAGQIEHSETHPIATRKDDFWDNGKVYK